ncbi:DNA-binding protein [Lagierella sp.]|uniref:PPC domain-containing DNA-binding protein n=1 Tax=Lagierella sp. TaxID=2849657 RepID=UPI00262C3D23|nr:DNA-binding protein [Lagierella sp.]
MDYRRFEDTILLRLDRGEDIHEKLEELASKEKINLALVQGIGALDKVTLGSYTLRDNDYKEENFEGEFELINLSGNISTKEDEFYAHLHVCLGDSEMKVFGGHLVKGQIALTGELFIKVIDGRADREKDRDLGINVLEF